MKLPHAERAFVDIVKLRDYSLDPAHPEGKHKARVFASALGLTRNDASWLHEQLLTAARSHECALGRKTEHGQGIPWILFWCFRINRLACAVRGTPVLLRVSLRLVSCYLL
jgi:hypothetical protein